jgi:hypothetical protein
MTTAKHSATPDTALTAAGPTLPPYPASLLAIACGGDHIAALESWGYRIGLAARDALAASGAIERGVGDRASHVEAISDHFGLAGEHHSLHVEPLRWLRLGETQATKGLQHFLAHDDDRIRLFLQALAPTIAWPSDLEGLSVGAEIPSGRGRIDLFIHGKAQGRTWGAVVEAKFEHGLKGNPLSEYMRHGAKLKMALAPDAAGGRTGALVVLGKKLSRPSRKKMSRNPHWRFVHWREILRRFDASLNEPTVDEEFRRFRRTLWERSGSAR